MRASSHSNSGQPGHRDRRLGESALADGEAAASPDFVAQLHDRHVRLFLYLRENEVGMRLDALRAVVAVHFRRADVAGDLDALGPAHVGRRTDIEPRGGLTARHPAPDRLHHLLAKIHRQRPDPLPGHSRQSMPIGGPLTIWESARLY